MSNEDGRPWVEHLPRFPVIQTPEWVEELKRRGTTYPVTGKEQVRASVNRTPPTPPAAPAGVAALEAEIASNSARQDAIKAELAGLEEAYTSAALLWDTTQDVTARVRMNAAADKMRSLRHEQNDLVEDAPRLRRRLEAARKAQRDAEHVEDLAQLERALDEIGPVVAEYAQLCVDLVELSAELVTRRNEINRLRRRSGDWSQHTGAPRCERDVNKEAYVPRFFAEWLDGSPRSLADAKRALGIQD